MCDTTFSLVCGHGDVFQLRILWPGVHALHIANINHAIKYKIDRLYVYVSICPSGSKQKQTCWLPLAPTSTTEFNHRKGIQCTLAFLLYVLPYLHTLLHCIFKHFNFQCFILFLFRYIPIGIAEIFSRLSPSQWCRTSYGYLTIVNECFEQYSFMIQWLSMIPRNSSFKQVFRLALCELTNDKLKRIVLLSKRTWFFVFIQFDSLEKNTMKTS